MSTFLLHLTLSARSLYLRPLSLPPPDRFISANRFLLRWFGCCVTLASCRQHISGLHIFLWSLLWGWSRSCVLCVFWTHTLDRISSWISVSTCAFFLQLLCYEISYFFFTFYFLLKFVILSISDSISFGSALHLVYHACAFFPSTPCPSLKAAHITNKYQKKREYGERFLDAKTKSINMGVRTHFFLQEMREVSCPLSVYTTS